MKREDVTVKDLLTRIHTDEEGLEPLQIVMIIAVAALIVIGLITVGDDIFNWMKQKWEAMKGEGDGAFQG